VGHTLRPLMPSIRVLEKAGFQLGGRGHDPQAPSGADVVRYELSRAAFEARTRG
jgi:RimJ/RimL family protein N-acetyltransferase